MMNPFRFALPRALLLFLGSLPVFPAAIRANEQPPSDEARAAARHELALGRCAFLAKDYAQARSRFERAAYEHVLVRDCDNSEAILAVADLYEQTGEEDTALDWLVNHSPRSSAAIMGVARLYRERRQDDKAHAWLIEHASMESVAVRARVRST